MARCCRCDVPRSGVVLPCRAYCHASCVQVGEMVWIPNSYDEAASGGKYRAKWLPAAVCTLAAVMCRGRHERAMLRRDETAVPHVISRRRPMTVSARCADV
jgi:hypothetical protein